MQNTFQYSITLISEKSIFSKSCTSNSVNNSVNMMSNKYSIHRYTNILYKYILYIS